jgi:hypothetical protein
MTSTNGSAARIVSVCSPVRASSPPTSSITAATAPVAVSQKTTVGRLGSIVPRSDSEPAMFVAAGQAGYMTTASGKDAVVAVDALNGTYPTVAEGIEKDLPARQSRGSAASRVGIAPSGTRQRRTGHFAAEKLTLNRLLVRLGFITLTASSRARSIQAVTKPGASPAPATICPIGSMIAL